jgi:hypothetical protein
MKWHNKIPEWVLGIVGLVSFLLIMILVSEIYRRFQMLWVCLWLSTPAMAYVVGSRRLDPHLTETGFKSLHLWLMVFAVGMSFLVFFDHSLKANFGHYFFKGSQFWVTDDGDTDDNGNPVASYEYYAPTRWGRFVLGAYDWVVIGLCLLLPFILHMSFQRSFRAKEQERYEQERLEYLRNNPRDPPTT